MPESVVKKARARTLRSLKVRSHSSSWPSAKMPLIIFFTSDCRLTSLGSARARLAASTASAIITSAASGYCGLGPG